MIAWMTYGNTHARCGPTVPCRRVMFASWCAMLSGCWRRCIACAGAWPTCATCWPTWRTPVPSGRICLGCGSLVVGMAADRCPPCQRDHAEHRQAERQAYRVRSRKAKDTHARGRSRRKVYDDPRWREVRALVIQRDGACRACGTTERLTVHHLAPAADDMAAALDPANLVTLCRRCHGRLDGPKANARRARAINGRPPRRIGGAS